MNNIKYKNTSNYQDLIKVLALTAMVIDHLGLYLFPEHQVMRLIGRTAMPAFCFFAGYNFHNKPRNSILFYGLSLYAINTIIFFQFQTTNILISMYLGQCYIFLFRDKLKKFFYTGYIHVVLLAIFWSVTKDIIDYGSLAISIMVLGYIAKHDKSHFKLAIFISIIISIFHTITVFNFFPIYVVIIGILQFLSMIIRDPNSQITINLNIISRNMLLIYFLHIIIIQIIFVYKSYFNN